MIKRFISAPFSILVNTLHGGGLFNIADPQKALAACGKRKVSVCVSVLSE